MKIVHVVDYLMPDMGYQEFLLAQYNLLDGHEVFIITSNKYYPVPNYPRRHLMPLYQMQSVLFL